jgi:hypothetical protein
MPSLRLHNGSGLKKPIPALSECTPAPRRPAPCRAAPASQASVLDKFKARDPPAAEFEEKLSKYSKVGEHASC